MRMRLPLMRNETDDGPQQHSVGGNSLSDADASLMSEGTLRRVWVLKKENMH